MILCAGRGERMRPFTDTQPKPLYLIEGRPLVEHHVIRLANAGFKKIIINHAWLGEKIRNHLGDGSRFNVSIEYSPEPPGGLETGGGIVNALPLLGEKPFVVVNGDIFTDFDFSALKLKEDCLMHMVLGAHTGSLGKKDFGLQDGFVVKTPSTHTFLGIACYHPSLFEKEKLRFFSVRSIWSSIIEDSKARGEIFDGKWLDIQTHYDASNRSGG